MQRGVLEKKDLLHFAPKLQLSLNKASDLFDRLDTDSDGLINLMDWHLAGSTLAYDGLVRCELSLATQTQGGAP